MGRKEREKLPAATQLADLVLAAWALLEALVEGLRVDKAELRRRHKALKVALDETRRE